MSTTKKTDTTRTPKLVPTPAREPDAIDAELAGYRAQDRRRAEQLRMLFRCDSPRAIANDFDHVFIQVEMLALAAWAKDNGYEDDEQIGDSSYSLAEALQELYRFLWHSSLQDVRQVFYVRDEDADDEPRGAAVGGVQ